MQSTSSRIKRALQRLDRWWYCKLEARTIYDYRKRQKVEKRVQRLGVYMFLSPILIGTVISLYCAVTGTDIRCDICIPIVVVSVTMLVGTFMMVYQPRYPQPPLPVPYPNPDEPAS